MPDGRCARCAPQTTTLSLPEVLERLRADRRRGAAVVPDLQIADHAAPVAPDALEVSWRPPTKNRERIASYKARIGLLLLQTPCHCSV